jgi:hypothetical protein
MSEGDAADNSPVDAPAALLIATDPSGQSDVRLEHIRDLSQQDYERFNQAYRTLTEVLFANPFTYFMGSAKMFHTVWTDANKALAAQKIRPNTDPDSFFIWTTQLRAAALTLCLSLAYHQEHTYQEISENHGNGSDAHQAAQKVFGELYDKYPGYGYMYSLRNVMAHDAMDAIALSATTMLDDSGEPVGMWDLKLDRAVMSQSRKLSKEKKAKFAALTENPSLPELFTQVAEPMREANRKLLGILHSDLTAVCRVAVEFDALFEGRAGTRALAHDRSPEIRPGMRLGFSSWSGEIIKFAQNYERGQDIGR